MSYKTLTFEDVVKMSPGIEEYERDLFFYHETTIFYILTFSLPKFL